MHFKQLTLLTVFFVFACIDTPDRDNPRDKESSAWDPPTLMEQSDTLLLSGDSDTLELHLHATDQGSISGYTLERVGANFYAEAKDGVFKIPVTSAPFEMRWSAIDNDGSSTESTFWVRRNLAPQITLVDSATKWVGFDWDSISGLVQVSYTLHDVDGVVASTRMNWNHVEVDWDTTMTKVVDSLPLDSNGQAFLRIVAFDEVGDSTVLLDTFAAPATPKPCTKMGRSSFVDSRDGQSYGCAWLDGKSWMTQNLNYGKVVVATGAQDDNNAYERYCTGDAANGCSATGGYYQWAEAIGEDYSCNQSITCVADDTPQGVCPVGWHIPSRTEWNDLEDALGADQSAFLGSPATYSGYINQSGGLVELDAKSHFWTSTNEILSASTQSAQAEFIQGQKGMKTSLVERKLGLSVRCVKD